jgi:hypothetical protein
MWQIEVSENASEEEIKEALLEQVDFEHIRDSVTALKGIVAKYGPFREIQEENENSKSNELVRTYHEKRGWTCDALEQIDGRKVWTYLNDPINGYSYLSNGYLFVGPKDRPSLHEIQSWFISEKPSEDSDLYVETEFIVSHYFTDSDEEGDFYFRLNLWDLIGIEHATDIEIIRQMSS